MDAVVDSGDTEASLASLAGGLTKGELDTAPACSTLPLTVPLGGGLTNSAAAPKGLGPGGEVCPASSLWLGDGLTKSEAAPVGLRPPGAELGLRSVGLGGGLSNNAAAPVAPVKGAPGAPASVPLGGGLSRREAGPALPKGRSPPPRAPCGGGLTNNAAGFGGRRPPGVAMGVHRGTASPTPVTNSDSSLTASA